METVKLEVKSVEEASRVELFVRFVWGFISYIVLYILMMINCLLLVVQWLIILITGKRNLGIASWMKKILVYATQFSAYLYLLTDERNPLIPEM